MAGFNEGGTGHAPQVKSNENPVEEISMENWNKIRSEIRSEERRVGKECRL